MSTILIVKKACSGYPDDDQLPCDAILIQNLEVCAVSLLPAQSRKQKYFSDKLRWTMNSRNIYRMLLF